MKKRILLSFGVFLLTTSTLFVSCKKDETPNVWETQRAQINRTINYTVLVVAGETSVTSGSSITKSAKVSQATQAATGAIVQVSVKGKVKSVTTDASGQATFTNLTAGIAAVTVSLDGHTTTNFTVNLYHMDSLLYDNEKERIA
jgi:hypothetical protein